MLTLVSQEALDAAGGMSWKLVYQCNEESVFDKKDEDVPQEMMSALPAFCLFYSQLCCCFCSLTKSCLILCDPRDCSMARLPCPSPSPGVCSNSCPSSWWCHPTISSSAVPFSSCPQSFPASVPFPISQFFTSGGQSIGVSASTSVLPMNTKDWSPLGWTGWLSLQSKGLSRVFDNTTVQKHQFFGVQPSLWSKSRIHTWLLEKA